MVENVSRHHATSSEAESGALFSAFECVPILVCRNIRSAVSYYRRLGFSVSWDPGGDGIYGQAFARAGRCALHIAENPDLDIGENSRTACIVVENPDQLAQEWGALGLGTTYPPRQIFPGYYGAHYDPDGNSIYFGRPAVLPGEEHNGRAT